MVNLIKYELKSSKYSDEGEKVPVIKKVYANEYSLSSSEQIRAQHEGLRLRGRVEIWSFEYDDEVDLQIIGKDRIYTILSVDKRGDKTFLSYGERLGG